MQSHHALAGFCPSRRFLRRNQLLRVQGSATRCADASRRLELGRSLYVPQRVFGAPRNLRPHYDIAPTTNVDVIRLDREGRRELVSMR